VKKTFHNSTHCEEEWRKADGSQLNIAKKMWLDGRRCGWMDMDGSRLAWSQEWKQIWLEKDGSRLEADVHVDGSRLDQDWIWSKTGSGWMDQDWMDQDWIKTCMWMDQDWIKTGWMDASLSLSGFALFYIILSMLFLFKNKCQCKAFIVDRISND